MWKREKINPTWSAKYIEVHLTNTLTWNTYLLELKPKVSGTAGMLSKLRHHTPKPLLKILLSLQSTFDICSLGIIYIFFIITLKLKDNALRIISFSPNTVSDNEIYKNLKKYFHHISLHNALLMKTVLKINYLNLYWIIWKDRWKT